MPSNGEALRPLMEWVALSRRPGRGDNAVFVRFQWRLILVLVTGFMLLGPAAQSQAAPSRDAASDALVALLPTGRANIVALSEAISSGDVARSQAAYARARVVWE